MKQEIPACPICFARYSAIGDAAYVCNFHSRWVITQCSSCGQTKFSDAAGICLDCSGDGHYFPPTASRDPRGQLRIYGYETGN
jgi:hypothetical protein